MTLDNNTPLFNDAIRFASETLNIAPAYIEKDYWITKMLARLAASDLATDVVWKGGTSLSKGYGLISRFSSDIDIAVIVGNKSGNQIKNLLSKATAIMTEGLNEVIVPGKTSKGSHYRRAYHRYNSLTMVSPEKSLLGEHVIVEINSFANPYPFEIVEVSSFIAQALVAKHLSKEIQQHNLQPFKINILDKRRTLSEKVASLLRFSFAENPIDELRSRIRHFYDLHYLLQDQDCIRYLETDFIYELKEIIKHDQTIFSTPAQWPKADVAESPLLTEFDQLWAKLKKRYEQELLILSFRPIPNSETIQASFKQILKKLQ